MQPRTHRSAERVTSTPSDSQSSRSRSQNRPTNDLARRTLATPACHPGDPGAAAGSRPCRSDVAALSLDFRPHGAPLSPIAELHRVAKQIELVQDGVVTQESGLRAAARRLDVSTKRLAAAEAGEPACIFCGCTQRNACMIPRPGFSATGGRIESPETACSWISLDPPVCSAPRCAQRLEAMGGVDQVRELLAAEPLPVSTTLTRLYDVQQLLAGGTRGPSSGMLLGGASYDAILEQLQLAVEEVDSMVEELESIVDGDRVEPHPDGEGGEWTLLDRAMARSNAKRRAGAIAAGIREAIDDASPDREPDEEDIAASARRRVAEQLDHESAVRTDGNK